MLESSRALRVAMASHGDEDTWRSASSLQQAAEMENQQMSNSIDMSNSLDETSSQMSIEDTEPADTHPQATATPVFSCSSTVHLITSSATATPSSSSSTGTNTTPSSQSTAGNNSSTTTSNSMVGQQSSSADELITIPVISLRMLMTSKDVGSIIGKAGMTIKAFREQSGAKINISNGTSSERLVTVTGSKDNISTAFSAMTAKIQQDNLLMGSPPKVGNEVRGGEESHGGSSSVSFRLIIQTSQCGSLIGKGGAKIKDIRESTGASIQIAGETLPNSTERAVTISGIPESVTRCIEEICDIVIESPPKGPFMPYKPHSVPVQTQPYQPRATLPFQAPYTATFNTASQPTTTTQHMRIPNDLIGCVIGRKGTKIHEIRVSSGAMIKIAGNEGDGSDRLVTITGSPESVGLAQYLINSRIHSEVNSFLLGTV